MVEFLKDAMDWVLDKEADVAKKCAMKTEDIEKQIEIMEKKRAEIRARFEEDDAEFAHILSRLSIIKAESMRCDINN